MVSFNYQAKEVTIKIVYYGPGLCGKTTSLQYIYSTLPQQHKGKMISLATQTDRTLFFDFLPIQLGKLKGLETKIQLYTVPGQVFYNQTRKLVLKGVDGIVFVADSQQGMLEANKDSLQNLMQNLESMGLNLKDTPHVFQYNKRDLPNLIDVETLNRELNIYNAPYFETSAITGEGVIETLRTIVKLTLQAITEKYNVELEEMIEEDSVDEQSSPETVSEVQNNGELPSAKPEPEEISAVDIEDMDTDVLDVSVDFDDRLLEEDSGVIEIDEDDEESLEVNEEELDSLEPVDLEDSEEEKAKEDDFETQKLDSGIIEENIETKDMKEQEGIEVEAPRVIKADNGYFVPITVKIPEDSEDEIRLNIDLKIEIKRKKRG